MQTEHGDKRIVSKVRYIGIMGGQLILGVTSITLFVCGAIGMFSTALLTLYCFCLLMIENGDDKKLFLLVFAFMSVAFIFSTAFTILGRAGIKRIQKFEDVVPLTRQNALDIPAKESLVRASSVQTIPDKTILLRPVQAHNDSASEELLRPYSSTD